MNGYVSQTQIMMESATSAELERMLLAADRNPNPEVRERVRRLVKAEQERRQGVR